MMMMMIMIMSYVVTRHKFVQTPYDLPWASCASLFTVLIPLL